MTTITAALTAEHRQGDRFFAAAMQAAEQADWLACHRQFDLFLQALKRHMKIEEEMLFPAFERATGVHDGPTSVMRREHQEMLAMLGEIATAIAARSTVDIRAAMQSFAGRMAAHSAKEERVLYPMCDEMLPDLNGEKLQELISQH
jgi:hemerythrin-like domain-containing protein